jgi:hypothetical protein
MLGEAWALALIVYAELTCAEPGEAETSEKGRRSPQRSPSNVSGHLRRLQTGHTASDEALVGAQIVGIAVPAGFTWVHEYQTDPDERVRLQWPVEKRLW